jgi:hypothetical protein
LKFNKFLPSDALIYKIARKGTMLTYLFLSPALCLWMQRKYRSLLYYLRRDSRSSEGEMIGLSEEP